MECDSFKTDAHRNDFWALSHFILPFSVVIYGIDAQTALLFVYVWETAEVGIRCVFPEYTSNWGASETISDSLIIDVFSGALGIFVALTIKNPDSSGLDLREKAPFVGASLLSTFFLFGGQYDVFYYLFLVFNLSVLVGFYFRTRSFKVFSLSSFYMSFQFFVVSFFDYNTFLSSTYASLACGVSNLLFNYFQGDGHLGGSPRF